MTVTWGRRDGFHDNNKNKVSPVGVLAASLIGQIEVVGSGDSSFSEKRLYWTLRNSTYTARIDWSRAFIIAGYKKDSNF